MNKYPVAALMMLLVIGLIAINNNNNIGLASKSAYQSGYDHGCDDANKPYNDRYIAQPGKGAGFHTEAFMDGYNKGQNECLDRNLPINNVPIR